MGSGPHPGRRAARMMSGRDRANLDIVFYPNICAEFDRLAMLEFGRLNNIKSNIYTRVETKFYRSTEFL